MGYDGGAAATSPDTTIHVYASSSLPALGNQTPRKAVMTAKGRKKVIAWLKMLENQSAQPRFEDPMGAYDFTWLWRELGVGDERR